ncbi:dynamin family protein [Campylobacter ureolyticus]|uniref:dynamin family protein n=1 Tax=Campylobacter ureolyticus TaxID=827 RepID=UPI0022B5CB26|nr:dynamin family protein [Campylobacter ureolyticus]MCZ6158063.1 dynamin family protein [Campylobacter ureolyticus]
MNIIEKTKNIENLVARYNLSVNDIKDKFSILKSSDLEKELDRMQDENRTLRIGVIGRVKSGKSSILNALFFNGENILPKAATPMTAALTILEYGKNLEAKVKFYTQSDIDDIKSNYEKYEKLKKEKTQNEIKKLIERKRLKIDELNQQEKDELKQKAEKIAEKELKNDIVLSSYFQQYEDIKNSSVSLNDFEKEEIITANNMEELNKKLLNFVGANGKFTSFTKSVTLKINEKRLENISVIDTPGVNDPIVSREEKTKDLLKTCDVVLVVSPSGQFLSSEDTNLLHRITKKDGIREIYLVASQVDSQLFGDVKEKNNGVFHNALESISKSLTTQQNRVIEELQQEYLKDLAKNKVILTSSVAFAMCKKFNNQGSWDENTKHAWGNLISNYPDFFNNTDSALLNLQKLANIETIENIISKVRDKKDEILKQKKEEFTSNKLRNLEDYIKAIDEMIEENINNIKNTDIKELEAKSKEMEKRKSLAIEKVNEAYDDSVENFELNLKDLLYEKSESFFRKLSDDVQNSEGSEEYSYQVKDNDFWNLWGLFGDKYQTKYSTRTTVKAGFVRNSIDETVSEVENLIDIEYKRNILEWKKNIYKVVISSARSVVGDEILDANIISRTIRGVLSNIKYPDINYNNDLPKELKKSGVLKGYEAENFISAVRDYAANLKGRVKNDIKNSVSMLKNSIQNNNIGENIFSKYDEEIKELIEDLNNKEQALERFEKIQKDLKNA